MIDKFGYYFGSGIKSHSKLVCVERGATTWHFHDEVYATCPRSDDPLSELYKQRARQIREKYDYVVLMYSGGADSGNVLDSFLNANLKIDEICTTWDFPTTGLRDSFHNAEIFQAVDPRLKELPHIKHRRIDLTQLIHTAMWRFGTNMEYYINHYASPNNFARQFLRDSVGDWKRIIESGRKLVLVWGIEKPILRWRGGKHYLVFKDCIDNCIGPYTLSRKGWYDELFYWSPEAPQIPHAQASAIHEFCTSIWSMTRQNDWMWQKEPTECGYNPVLMRYLKYDAMKIVIYPWWNPLTFTNGKSASMVYSARDAHFFQGNVNNLRFEQVIDSYYNQMQEITPKAKRHAIYPMYSREYEVLSELA